MSDQTTLGSFARRQLDQEWSTAHAGAMHEARKLKNAMANALADLSVNEIPGGDVQDIAARYAAWQTRLAQLRQIREVLDKDKEPAHVHPDSMPCNAMCPANPNTVKEVEN